MEITEDGLFTFFGAINPHLDERQRRLLVGSMSELLPQGSRSAIARSSGMSRNTVIAGAEEIAQGAEVSDEIRSPGAGRKKLIELDPDLLVELDALVAPESRGDPMSALRWTIRSARQLAGALGDSGHKVSHPVVLKALRYLGYSPQRASRTDEGTSHPDRDGQFHHIADQATIHQLANQPVISVDGKKKELVGNFDPDGTAWEPEGQPPKVNAYDFLDDALGKAVPYGIYDLAANEGYVSVGDSKDTAQFAVHSIDQWWTQMGKPRYPQATRLMIACDGGGSNASRSRLWKTELAKFADKTGLEVTVCHYPPGTSKWNKIEHRLFSYITLNWRGQPLTSYEVVVNLIANTTTKTGLKVKAALDTTRYETGIKVSDKELAAIDMTPHEFHGEWNYRITGMRK